MWFVPTSTLTKNSPSNFYNYSTFTPFTCLFFINILLKLLRRLYFISSSTFYSYLNSCLSPYFNLTFIKIFCCSIFIINPICGNIERISYFFSIFPLFDYYFCKISISKFRAKYRFGLDRVKSPFNEIPFKKTCFVFICSYYIFGFSISVC